MFEEFLIDKGKEIVQNKSDKKELQSKLDEYIDKQAQYNEKASLDEEIDFEGLSKYIKKDLLNNLPESIFSPNKDKRTQTEKDIIAKAVEKAKAKKESAKKRVEKYIIECLGIIRIAYTSKVELSYSSAMSEFSDSITNNSDKNTKKIIDAIEKSNDVKALNEKKEQPKKVDSPSFYKYIMSSLEKFLDFDNWDNWTSMLIFNDQPELSDEILEQINDAITFINKIIWLHEYPEWENAITNLNKILNDFQNTFIEHAESHYISDLVIWKTKKFYKTSPYNREYYERTLPIYKRHRSLISNLVLEMTRACNLICDCYRKNIDKNYRMKQGKLNCGRCVPEYESNEQYPDELKEFEKLLETRDYFVKLE